MQKERSYRLRHRLISSIADLNLPGFNGLAVFLSRKLIPKVKGSEAIIIHTIHGIKLWIDPSLDHGVERSLYEFGTYEKGIIHFMQKHIKVGDIVMDVGANIGLMTCIASRKTGSNGKVLAFEANPKTVEILKDNLKLNQCKNVELFPFGLGNEKTKALFYENWEVNRGGASFLKQGEQNGTEVEIDTLDKLFPDGKLDLIKIDVEGFELEVLKGGINLLRKNQPVFILEVSKNREHEKGVNPSEIRDFILSVGAYRIYKLKGTKERKSRLIEIHSEHDLPEHDNIICIPASRL